MIKSMTGFGREHIMANGREIIVEIRSVNHRYYEFTSRTPRAYGYLDEKLKGFLKSFAEPAPIMLPINILEVVIRPTSLCMRLFGNVLGSYVVMKLLEFICPAVLPIPFSLYFDFFDGFIQAYVFVFLTSLFIKEAIE